MSRTSWPGPIEQLGGDVALLGQLRVFEALARMLEIGAGILHVGIEEELVERVPEVVMVGDVVAGPARVVALAPPPQGEPQTLQCADPGAGVRRVEIGESDLQRLDQFAFLDDDGLVHVQFAEGEGRVAQEPQFGGGVPKCDPNPRTAPVAAPEDGPGRGPDHQVAPHDERCQETMEQAVHRLSSPGYGRGATLPPGSTLSGRFWFDAGRFFLMK